MSRDFGGCAPSRRFAPAPHRRPARWRSLARRTLIGAPLREYPVVPVVRGGVHRGHQQCADCERGAGRRTSAGRRRGRQARGRTVRVRARRVRPGGPHDRRSVVDGEKIPHAWEGATLVVRASDEAAVDHILEQVEAGTGLDPDAEQVVYELGDWPEEQRTQLVEALGAAASPSSGTRTATSRCWSRTRTGSRPCSTRSSIRTRCPSTTARRGCRRRRGGRPAGPGHAPRAVRRSRPADARRRGPRGRAVAGGRGPAGRSPSRCRSGSRPRCGPTSSSRPERCATPSRANGRRRRDDDTGSHPEEPVAQYV